LSKTTIIFASNFHNVLSQTITGFISSFLELHMKDKMTDH